MERIGAGAPVYLAAVLQYLTVELIDIAALKAKADKKSRITPRHIMLAIKSDAEISKLLKNGDFAGSGVVPGISDYLKGKGKK